MKLATAVLFSSPALAFPALNILSVFKNDRDFLMTPRHIEAIVSPLSKRELTLEILDPEKFDVREWNKQANEECTKSITALNGQFTNSAGLIACYNIPMLDYVTGIMESELRIFRTAPPSEAWKDVKFEDMKITVTNPHVILTETSGLMPMQRSKPAAPRRLFAPSSSLSYSSSSKLSSYNQPLNRSVFRRQAPTPSQTPPTIEMLKIMTHIGILPQKDFLQSKSTYHVAEEMIPKIMLMGINPFTRVPVLDELSANGASFVAGNFRVNKLAEVNGGSAAAKAEAKKEEPFVLPGVNIEIFPLGGIITGSWAILFITTVGLGTLGRIGWRKEYLRSNGK